VLYARARPSARLPVCHNVWIIRPTCTNDANMSHLFADIDGIRHVDHEVGDKTPAGVIELRFVAGEGEYE